MQALVGDRSSDLSALAGQRFDAVVDTCGYAPADVRRSAEALREVETYCFVSSISAYRSFVHPPIREIDPLADFSTIDPADRDLAHYGPQKAACEAEVQKVFGERALIVRPGLIVGPGDRSGRFSHWPWRALDGGEMLVPDLGDGRAAAVHRRARPRRLDGPPGRARRSAAPSTAPGRRTARPAAGAS